VIAISNAREGRARRDRGHCIMNEATRLMNLLVAICGDQIRDYRPQLEALARKLAKTGGRS